MSDEKIKVQVDEDLEDLIPGFLENRNTDVNKLKTALDSGNFADLTSIGHSLKGVGGGYGFDQMSELGAAIESAAKAEDADTVRDKINLLEDYLQRVEIEYV